MPVQRGRLRAVTVGVILALGVGLTACRDVPPEPDPAPGTPAPSSSGWPNTTTSPDPSLPADRVPTPATAPDPAWVVRYRVAVDHPDLLPETVALEIRDILSDPRGWSRAGFVFAVDGPDAPPSSLPVATITVADGAVVDERCRPYDTFGRYSCQLGPNVNLNADRWIGATPEWGAATEDDLDRYRTYLVNHEVGHLLGLHHPKPQCPGAGLPAPIMLQQSTELGACTANPWPLTWEIELAASRVEPFAPGYEPDPEGRPSPPAVRQ